MPGGNDRSTNRHVLETESAGGIGFRRIAANRHACLRNRLTCFCVNNLTSDVTNLDRNQRQRH